MVGAIVSVARRTHGERLPQPAVDAAYAEGEEDSCDDEIAILISCDTAVYMGRALFNSARFHSAGPVQSECRVLFPRPLGRRPHAGANSTHPPCPAVQPGGHAAPRSGDHR